MKNIIILFLLKNNKQKVQIVYQEKIVDTKLFDEDETTDLLLRTK